MIKSRAYYIPFSSLDLFGKEATKITLGILYNYINEIY
jgi:hypothetical protein